MVWTRPFALMLVATFGAFCGFFATLPVVPLWASEGGAGPSGAGATTGTLMLMTVVGQLIMPRLLRRLTLRTTLGAGLLLFGIPTPLFGISPELWRLIAISAICGIAFGLVTVSGSALVAVLVPASHRGRGAGLYGFSVGIPALVVMPLGLWAVGEVGYVPVFAAAGLLPVLGAIAVWRIGPARSARTLPRPGLRRGLAGPWALMATTGLAMGATATFLPLATADQRGLAGLALLLLPAAMTIARYAAGLAGDRVGTGRLLVPGILASAAGMICIASGTVPAVLAGAVLFGAGFGTVQNQSLIVMFARADAGTASIVWNIGYDGGFCLAGYALGVVIAGFGFATGFTVAGLLIAACLPVAVRIARAARPRFEPLRISTKSSPSVLN